jgi:hypothetical protein
LAGSLTSSPLRRRLPSRWLATRGICILRTSGRTHWCLECIPKSIRKCSRRVLRHTRTRIRNRKLRRNYRNREAPNQKCSDDLFTCYGYRGNNAKYGPPPGTQFTRESLPTWICPEFWPIEDISEAENKGSGLFFRPAAGSQGAFKPQTHRALLHPS